MADTVSHGPARGAGRKKLKIMEAVRWAFSTVWHNPGIWVLGTFLLFIGFFVVLVLLGLGIIGIEHLVDRELIFDVRLPAGWELPNDFGPEISLIPLLLTPVLYAGALSQLDRPRIKYADFIRNIHYWKVIFISLAGAMFWWAVDYLVSAAIPPRFEEVGTDDTSFWHNLGAVVVGLVVLFFTILTHLFTLAWAWYVADGYGFGQAVVEGTKAVGRNVFRLILLYVVGIVLFTLGMIFTLMIGGLILVPASLLIAAHLCRQANGGELPHAA